MQASLQVNVILVTLKATVRPLGRPQDRTGSQYVGMRGQFRPLLLGIKQVKRFEKPVCRA